MGILKKNLSADKASAKSAESVKQNNGSLVRKLWIICILLVVTITVSGYAVRGLFHVDSGYTVISGCSIVGADADFTFNYYLGAGDLSAAAERTEVQKIYADACDRAYMVFSADEEYDGVVNLADLNHNPNRTLTVEPELYDALRLIKESGSRSIFTAPLLSDYHNLFLADNDIFAAEFDPYVNSRQREYFSAVAAYVNDPKQVDIILDDDGSVMLYVSSEYLAFAEENEIDSFLDLYLLKNAFSVDYISDRLCESGYTYGYITTADGYIRNTDSTSGTDYGMTVYDLREQNLAGAAVFGYKGAASIVYLSTFPVSGGEGYRFYITADGSRRTPYINTQDGICRAETDALIMASGSYSCAELAITALDLMSSGTPGGELMELLDDKAADCDYIVLDNGVLTVRGQLLKPEAISDGYSYVEG